MTIEDIKFQIERLMTKAESGADWAEICRLEAEMVKRISEGEEA